MFISFGRSITSAFQDIGRNLSLSVMTILILILMLLSVNTLLLIRFLTNQATRSITDQIDVSIYFTPTATDEQIAEVKKYISAFPEVTEVIRYSRAEVLAQFQSQYENNPAIVASLQELGDNPLGSTLVVKTRSAKDYQKIITALAVPEYEEIVVAKTFTDTEKAIDRIHIITTQVERFSVILTALFAVIAFLIIFNTIRVAIYTQRMEISIKKLVGATNWFIRGPYFIESLIFTLLSVALTVLLVFFAARFLDPYVAVVFGRSAILTNYFVSHILWLFGIQFGAVLLLTLFSSALAMRRHLRV